MTTVHAYAASKPDGALEPFEYELGPIGANEVDIAVESCGIAVGDTSEETQRTLARHPAVVGRATGVHTSIVPPVLEGAVCPVPGADVRGHAVWITLGERIVPSACIVHGGLKGRIR